MLGDARLALEREAPQNFDVLAVDAFSGDSVPDPPDHRRGDGRLPAAHGARRRGRLPRHQPLPRAGAGGRADRAARKGLHAALVHDEADNTPFRATDWVLVARDPQALMRDPIRGATSAPEPIASLEPWTDDFNNLFGVLK